MVKTLNLYHDITNMSVKVYIDKKFNLIKELIIALSRVQIKKKFTVDKLMRCFNKNNRKIHVILGDKFSTLNCANLCKN